MIIALFIIIAAVVSMPMAAIVVVSIASRREDAAWTLGKPAPGTVQSAARRLLDFHTEDPAWPLPKNCGQARPVAPVLRSIGQGSVGQGSVAHPRRSTVTDAPRSAAASKVSIRTAA
jgi:hypothetical protein